MYTRNLPSSPERILFSIQLVQVFLSRCSFFFVPLLSHQGQTPTYTAHVDTYEEKGNFGAAAVAAARPTLPFFFVFLPRIYNYFSRQYKSLSPIPKN
jgi:hypothetical protein